MGLHAYELVRDGQILGMLTEEELQRLDEDNVLDNLTDASRRSVDDDELYYLLTMRRIIKACGKPYCARAEVFQAILTDLHVKRNTPEFPLVAGRLLLVDIEKGHVIQARDRANCEAWALMRALATGRKAPPYQVNPLTGEKYEVERREGRITVSNVGGQQGDDTPWAVPDPAAG
jgi:hypothetical protein